MATSKEKLQIIVDAQGIAKTKAQLKGMDSATGGATKSFGAMAAGIAGATVALYALGKATSFAIRTGKDFEQGMANVKAISGATGQEFKALEANARKLGASTKFTATEVAGLQTEFSKLGFTATEINKVTKGTLALAAATGSDLAVSAEVAGATLRGFGLDASETGKVTDVMAKSFSSSALDMSKFSDSMKFVAPVAKMAGFQIEGTTAILGQLANAGLHGSMAGTALRSIFLKLADTNSALSKRLGGSVNSVEELIPALNKLKDEGVDLTEMLELTDKRAVTAFGVLLDGSDDVNTLAESLRNAGGAAQEMADIQLDTLEGRMTIMKSATEGLGIALFDHLAPGLNSAVEGMTSLISTTTKWLEIPSSEKIAEEQVELNALVNALMSSNKKEKERDHWIKEINKINPELLKGLDNEQLNLKEVRDRLNEVNKSYEKRISLAIQEQVFIDNQKEAKELWVDLTENIKEYNKFLGESDVQGFLEDNNIWIDTTMSVKDQLSDLENQYNANIDAGIEMSNTNEEGSVSFDKLFAAMGDVMGSSKEYYKLLEDQRRQSELATTEINAQADAQDRLNKANKGENGEKGEPPAVTGVPSDEEMANALMLMSEYQTSLRDIKITAAEQELSDEEQKLINAAEILDVNEAVITQIQQDYQGKRDKIEEDSAKKKKKLQKEILHTTLGHYSQLAGGSAAFLKQFAGGEKAAARIQQTKVAIDTISATMKAFATGGGWPAGLIPAAASAAYGAAQMLAISKSIGEFKTAQTGLDEIITKPTLIMAGEKNMAEKVEITPLEGPNEFGPQGGGQSISVSIQGNVMTDQFVEEELSEKISEAIRRGVDFGI